MCVYILLDAPAQTYICIHKQVRSGIRAAPSSSSMACVELPSCSSCGSSVLQFSCPLTPATPEMQEEMDTQSTSTASAFSDLMLRTLHDFRTRWTYEGAMLRSLAPAFPWPCKGTTGCIRLLLPSPLAFASHPTQLLGWTLSQGSGLSFKSSRNLLNRSYKRVIND